MLLERLERFARRTPALVRLYNSPGFQAVYNRALFPITVPFSAWAEPGKVRLILSAKPHTLLSWKRLSALHDAAKTLDADKVPGAIVECGVWKGGSAAVLAKASRRPLWLFDSWEGFPEPSAEDVSVTESHGASKGMFAATEDDVRAAFSRVGVNAEERATLVKGWFDKTLPATREQVGAIALLHLDADLYESSKTCLEQLWDKLSPGGWLFIDDYGNWRGCRKAVDEFFLQKGLKPEWTQVDFTGVRWRKP